MRISYWTLRMSGILLAPKSPLACDRQALTTEQRKRHFEILGPHLRSRLRRVHELADGYEFEFPGDAETFELVADWASGERLCCPFFQIDLEPGRQAGTLWLRLTGQEGAKRGIRSELSHFFEAE